MPPLFSIHCTSLLSHSTWSLHLYPQFFLEVCTSFLFVSTCLESTQESPYLPSTPTTLSTHTFGPNAIATINNPLRLQYPTVHPPNKRSLFELTSCSQQLDELPIPTQSFKNSNMVSFKGRKTPGYGAGADQRPLYVLPKKSSVCAGALRLLSKRKLCIYKRLWNECLIGIRWS